SGDIICFFRLPIGLAGFLRASRSRFLSSRLRISLSSLRYISCAKCCYHSHGIAQFLPLCLLALRVHWYLSLRIKPFVFFLWDWCHRLYHLFVLLVFGRQGADCFSVCLALDFP